MRCWSTVNMTCATEKVRASPLLALPSCKWRQAGALQKVGRFRKARLALAMNAEVTHAARAPCPSVVRCTRLNPKS